MSFWCFGFWGFFVLFCFWFLVGSGLVWCIFVVVLLLGFDWLVWAFVVLFVLGCLFDVFGFCWDLLIFFQSCDPV